MCCASLAVAVTLRRGQETCSSEMSCTTSTRLCEASATARWKSRDSRVNRSRSSMAACASASSPRSLATSAAVAFSAASSAPSVSMARCASMISAAETPVRSSCTASASANSRGLPCAMRAPPPLPMRISTMPSASSVRRASRATMRLLPKRAARSFSVPRKSPGLSRLANSSSRTWPTIRADSEEARPANMIRAVRSPLICTGCRKARVMVRVMARARDWERQYGAAFIIVKILSLRISFQVQRVDQDSVHRDMRLLDDIAPGQRLLLDESGRLSRGAAAGFEVEVVEVRLDLGLLQHLADRLVELVDDGLGRAGRRADGVPGPRFEVFHADFGKGRDVLERRDPFPGRHRQDARLAALVQPQGGGELHEDHVDMAGDDVVERRRRALVGHVHELGVGDLLEQRRRQMRRRADA